jgi:hypothetical protein
LLFLRISGRTGMDSQPRWSSDEWKQVEILYNQGYSYDEISRICESRTGKAIRQKNMRVRKQQESRKHEMQELDFQSALSKEVQDRSDHSDANCESAKQFGDGVQNLDGSLPQHNGGSVDMDTSFMIAQPNIPSTFSHSQNDCHQEIQELEFTPPIETMMSSYTNPIATQSNTESLASPLDSNYYPASQGLDLTQYNTLTPLVDMNPGLNSIPTHLITPLLDSSQFRNDYQQASQALELSIPSSYTDSASAQPITSLPYYPELPLFDETSYPVQSVNQTRELQVPLTWGFNIGHTDDSQTSFSEEL